MDRSVAPTPERRLGGALEPVIGQVYFSPEAHEGYTSLGFEPSVHRAGDVQLPDGPAYFTSRGSVMGRVSGEVVASAFAVFNPQIVVPSVEFGWTLTDSGSICAARDTGALGQLDRILGAAPAAQSRIEELLRRATEGVRVEGRPLAAGITGLPDPDHPLGTIWRRGDLLREFRGDSHTAAWITADFDAVEIGLLTELYWGLSPRSYARTRGWTDEHFDAASQRLRSRGLIDEDGMFTVAGRDAREEVERNTDAQMAPVMMRLGEDLDELIALLEPWGRAIRSAGGYLSSGPHDLAAPLKARRGHRQE